MPHLLNSPIAELLNYGKKVSMAEILTLSSRGTLTVPARLRKQLGLKTDQVLVAEVTSQGLLLRPHQVVPLVRADQAVARPKKLDLSKARDIPKATIEAWVRRDEADKAKLRKSASKQGR